MTTANDPAAVHAAVQTALWDTAEHEGMRLTPGTLERLANAAVNAMTPTPTAADLFDLAKQRGHEIERLKTEVAGLRQDEEAAEHYRVKEYRRVMDALLPITREHGLTRLDTLGNGLSVGHVAESAAALLRHQEVELSEWRSGSRITQESSDTQDALRRAREEITDLRRDIRTMADLTGSAFAAADRAYRAWTQGTTERWQDHVKTYPDADARWMRVAEAVLADQLAPGTRVKVGECFGTVERQPRRVLVRLEGACPAMFDARFVHPVTDAEEG